MTTASTNIQLFLSFQMRLSSVITSSPQILSDGSFFYFYFFMTYYKQLQLVLIFWQGRDVRSAQLGAVTYVSWWHPTFKPQMVNRKQTSASSTRDELNQAQKWQQHVQTKTDHQFPPKLESLVNINTLGCFSSSGHRLSLL